MIYIQTIRTAILLFPVIALLLTIPYMIWEYHKYGAILILRTLIIYSFIFYLMCAYFLTILPLPTFEEVLNSTQPIYELRPFHSIGLILHESPLIISDPSTYLPTLFSPNFLQVFFNILLVLILLCFYQLYLLFLLILLYIYMLYIFLLIDIYQIPLIFVL